MNTRNSRPFFRSRRDIGAALLGGLAGLPIIAWANSQLRQRPVQAFRADTTSDTLEALFDDTPIKPSPKLRIVAADLAENGAVVPIKVDTDFHDVMAISIIATRNPVPLVAQFVFAEPGNGFLATRIKLAESGPVIVVAETADGFYRAEKNIEVTIGGCGV